MTTYTKATIVTGTDERGNELSLRYYPEGWFDVYEEKPIPEAEAQRRIGPNCVVRFNEATITGARWFRMGSPTEIETERISELREPERPDESGRVSEWLGEAVAVVYGQWDREEAERQAELGGHTYISGGEVEER